MRLYRGVNRDKGSGLKKRETIVGLGCGWSMGIWGVPSLVGAHGSQSIGLRIFCYTLNPEQPESVGFRVQGMTILGGSARTSPCRLGIGITGVSTWLKGVMNFQISY